MALFRKKPPNDGDDGNGNGGDDQSPEFTPQPEKARKWFDHAKSMADRYNYDAALSYYANGIKFDPESMSAHEAMYEAAIQYTNRGGKPAASKERRAIEDTTAVSKFAAAEFEWMKNIRDANLGLKAIESAVKADQLEAGNWLASKMLGLVRTAKKINKTTLVKAKDVFAAVGAWDEAIACGEMASLMDPSDSELSAELKNLAAQRAMDQGGYEQAAGKEGGFREMIRDVDKQRELEEESAISGGKTTEERNLGRAQEAYEANPNDIDAVNRYAQLLKKAGDVQKENLAYDIYLKAFEDSREYRFRMNAGDIKIDQLRRSEKALAKKLEAGEDVQADLEAAANERRALQAEEYAARVEQYPTDRHMKFQLGIVEFELGRFDVAMGCFQKAKDEPRLRVRSGHMLGKCFAAESWHGEAIGEYRDALDAIDATERERELDIRYDMMVSLIEDARSTNSVDQAKEALEICSGIARKDITYRDIRNRRKQIDLLVKELSG